MPPIVKINVQSVPDFVSTTQFLLKFQHSMILDQDIDLEIYNTCRHLSAYILLHLYYLNKSSISGRSGRETADPARVATSGVVFLIPSNVPSAAMFAASPICGATASRACTVSERTSVATSESGDTTALVTFNPSLPVSNPTLAKNFVIHHVVCAVAFVPSVRTGNAISAALFKPSAVVSAKFSKVSFRPCPVSLATSFNPVKSGVFFQKLKD
ncbi:hypothetical protein DERF_000598 [Dermatophagoides farinae]|uniref:Uncharacterized protein n=1 Tax=Dermatophagoides farinae TaxID=6954 RepID=A0A922I7Q1_DERFA|nr:hypothetical protein DERF_000598 [Dermatophagoides farinae]